MLAWTYGARGDGYSVRCPFNSMRPKPWGLYQGLGNVREVR